MLNPKARFQIPTPNSKSIAKKKGFDRKGEQNGRGEYKKKD